MTVTQPALAPPLISSRPTPDGGRILSCEVLLEPYEASVGLLLRRWAAEAPQRVFLAERDRDGGWATLSFAQASFRADAVAHRMDHQVLASLLPCRRMQERPGSRCGVGRWLVFVPNEHRSATSQTLGSTREGEASGAAHGDEPDRCWS